jgi:hypothetical protein
MGFTGRRKPTDLVQRLVQPIWYRIGTILSYRKSLPCKDLRVEDRGLEPLTSCMPCKRSPS